MADFAQKLNDAVRKETNGRIKKTFFFENKPNSFTKVPENSVFAPQMDTLIKKYGEVTAPFIAKGVHEYGTTPVSSEFPANFPIACVLARPSSPESNYEETQDGAILTLHHDFQCRAYKINAKFLETVKEWQREDRIPEGEEPVPYLFAQLSGMMHEFVTLPDPAKDIVVDSIIAGVTLYIPEDRVVLAIETKNKHEEMTKNMQERLFLERPSHEEEKDQQAPNKKPLPTGKRPATSTTTAPQ